MHMPTKKFFHMHMHMLVKIFFHMHMHMPLLFFSHMHMHVICAYAFDNTTSEGKVSCFKSKKVI